MTGSFRYFPPLLALPYLRMYHALSLTLSAISARFAAAPVMTGIVRLFAWLLAWLYPFQM